MTKTDTFDPIIVSKPKLKLKPLSDDHPWVKLYIKKLEGSWCSYEDSGKRIPGRCVALEFTRLTERGSIPDFEATVESMSRTERKLLLRPLVDSRLRFHDSEQEALTECGLPYVKRPSGLWLMEGESWRFAYCQAPRCPGDLIAEALSLSHAIVEGWRLENDPTGQYREMAYCPECAKMLKREDER